MPIQRRTWCLPKGIDWVSSPTTNEPIRAPCRSWQNTTSDARFHRIASSSAVVKHNFDTPNQAFISLPCTTSKYSKSPSFIWDSYKASPYMQLGKITVHSSLSRDCSDIMVSGSLKATLVQAEMPLRLRFWVSRVPALCLHYYPKVGKVKNKLNFPPLIVQY